MASITTLIDESAKTAGRYVTDATAYARETLNSWTSDEVPVIGSEKVNSQDPLMITTGNDSTSSTMAKSLVYPVDLLEPDQRNPFMEIVAFKYERDPSSIKNSPANTWSNSTPPSYNVARTKIEYVLRLPLQGNMQQGFQNILEDSTGTLNKAINVFGGMAENGTEAKEAAAKMISMADNSISSPLKAIETAAAALTNRLGVVAGLSINPAIEVVYKATGMRGHQFELTMMPRSKEEAEKVEEICYYMQKFSLGRETTGTQGLLLDYPLLHEIRYYAWDGEGDAAFPKELKGVTRVPDSFIDSIQVVHNPMGFARLSTDNRALATKLTLSFREIKAVTRDDFDSIYVKGGTIS